MHKAPLTTKYLVLFSLITDTPLQVPVSTLMTQKLLNVVSQYVD